MKKILLLALVPMAFSCNDDDLDFRELTSSGIATVWFSGEVTVDGCGWVVDIDSTDYKPINLPKTYEREGLFIVSGFDRLDEPAACGLDPENPEQVRIRNLPDNNAVEIYWDQTYCSDPWNKDGGSITDAETATQLVDYLAGKGVGVYSIRMVEYPYAVEFCLACHCKTGRRIIINIHQNDLQKAIDLGFGTNVCTTEDPLKNIPWLKELKETFEQSSQAAGTRIVQYEYEGECVFLVDDCYGCADALQVVYNFDQEKICEFGGIDGRNTCPDFMEKATGKIILWHNIQPQSSLAGQWHMVSHECCLLPAETFSKNDVIWNFDSQNSLNVTLNIELDKDSQLPLTQSGTYEYAAGSTTVTIDGVEYDYYIKSGELTLSDSPESDGPIMRFVK